ncbi:MAG: iron ABC transporter permease [Alphaproteobacteria bacterium]|nr:iron ABC transporter permease [Alphaproteobacteria bacterium]
MPPGWTALALLNAACMAAPVLAVLWAALRPAGAVWQHLADTWLLELLLNSALLALGVGAVALSIGVICAWLVTVARFPGRDTLMWALLLPLAMPGYLMAYVYTELLDFTGPVQGALRAAFGWGYGDYWFPEVRSLAGAIAVLGLTLYPYVYMLCRAAFLEQSVCLLEVSRTLGCGPWGRLGRVALPLARPAMAGGVALAVMEALNDFGAVQHFAVKTFTTGIYETWFGMGDRGAASQLAAALLAAVALMLAIERITRGRRAYHGTTTRHQPLEPQRLGTLAGLVACIACALPVLLGFGVPALALLWNAIDSLSLTELRRLLPYAWHSLSLSAATAVAAVAIATVLAYGARLYPSRAQRLATRLSGMGYAIPGSVIAVGVLVPFGAFDNALDAWARAHLGFSTGLLLSGSMAALVFGYLVRFLAVALVTVEAGLAKVRPSLDGAARTLGRGPRRTLFEVHAPLISGSLITAGLLVFVETMKELPATLIIRPFDFDTLAVRVYQLASDEKLAQAAPAALTIVLVGLIPVVVLSRAMRRSTPVRSR